MKHDDWIFVFGLLLGVGMSVFWFAWGHAARYAKAWNAGRWEMYQDNLKWATEHHECPQPPGNVMVAK